MDSGSGKPRIKPVDKHKRLNKDWKAIYRQVVPQERVGKDGKSESDFPFSHKIIAAARDSGIGIAFKKK